MGNFTFSLTKAGILMYCMIPGLGLLTHNLAMGSVRASVSTEGSSHFHNPLKFFPLVIFCANELQTSQIPQLTDLETSMKPVQITGEHSQAA